MPGPYGVTPQGFNPKSSEEIQADLDSAWRTAFGSGVDTSDDSPDGNIIGIFTDRFSELWEGMKAIYDGAFPESAAGVALNRVAALSPGITRKTPTKSLVNVVLSGTPATNIPAGSRARVAGSDVLFETTALVVLNGVGLAMATMTAVETGPRHAPANTLTVIDTPVAGWAAVTNANDQFLLGTDLEKDPAFRARRDQSMRVNGSSSEDAIRASILDRDPNVTSCRVFVNESDNTVDGMPPHSIEAVVLGGTDGTIAQVIYEAKPAAQPTTGNTTSGAVDSIGNAKTIKFSRPVDQLAYIIVNVTCTKNAPENAAFVITEAIADWGDVNLIPDSELVAQALVPTVFNAIPGVYDCAVPLIGLAPAPGTSATINSTPRQITRLDSSRITVNVTRI